MLMKQLKWVVFPLAISSNLFSVTALLIFFGVTGKLELAADIAVVQGAALTVFLAFSGNSRNLLLSGSAKISFGQLARFRGLFVLPFGLAVYFLCKSISAVPDFLILVLIVRRCAEWLAELIVTDREAVRDHAFAQWYVFLQTITFSSLLLNGFIANEIYNVVFCFWAISPILMGARYFLRAFSLPLCERFLPAIGYILHLGSSWAIATSTFVFRLVILALTSKVVSGELFTAFAIGGMLSSVYTYVIGPSLISKETFKVVKVFRIIVWVCISIGGLIVFTASIISAPFLGSKFFIQAVGYSVIGGAIMMVAQRQRIILLQVKHKSVFVPDMLASVLIVTIIPLLFYVFSVNALVLLFLCNALLTWVFYKFTFDRKE